MSSFCSCGVASRLISGFSLEINNDQDKMQIKIRYINEKFFQIKHKQIKFINCLTL